MLINNLWASQLQLFNMKQGIIELNLIVLKRQKFHQHWLQLAVRTQTIADDEFMVTLTLTI